MWGRGVYSAPCCSSHSRGMCAGVYSAPSRDILRSITRSNYLDFLLPCHGSSNWIRSHFGSSCTSVTCVLLGEFLSLYFEWSNKIAIRLICNQSFIRRQHHQELHPIKLSIKYSGTPTPTSSFKKLNLLKIGLKFFLQTLETLKMSSWTTSNLNLRHPLILEQTPSVRT